MKGGLAGAVGGLDLVDVHVACPVDRVQVGGLILAGTTGDLGRCYTGFIPAAPTRSSSPSTSHGYRTAMGIPLSESALRLVDGRNYAVLATVNPDGSPQTSVVWIGRDGGDLLFSTVEGRVKPRNMLRDPRVSVTVIDSADPENYVELRGRVSMTPDVGRRVDTRLSWKYDGKDPGEDRPGAVRVVVRITVEKATGYGA